jgi:group I intron endonuclease
MDFTYNTKKASLQGVCGIYMLRNKINDKKYIGSSKDVYYRLASHKHKIKSGKHDNEHLQNSCRLHGLEFFEASVVEQCDEASLASREIYWIDKHDCLDKEKGYNKSDVSDTRKNVVLYETRSKISKSLMNGSSMLMLDKVSGKPVKKFDSLFEAAEYIISAGLSSSKPSNVRIRISNAARNKMVNSGYGRIAKRSSAYGYKWEVCHRLRMW